MMSYKTNPEILRPHFYRSRYALDLNQKFNKWDKILFINNYLKMMLKTHIKLPKKGQKTKRRRGLRLISSPIIVGNFYTQQRGSHLKITLKFFFDKELALLRQIKNFETKLSKIQLYLTKRLNLFVQFRYSNVYDFTWLFKLFMFCEDYAVQAKVESLKSLPKYSGLYKYFTKIKIVYTRYKFFFRRFKRNRYYQRISDPMFGLLCYRHPDPFIIAQMATRDLANLRQHHKRFVFFIVKSLGFCARRHGRKSIRGVFVTVKGRLTLRTRQVRRKQIRHYRVGKLYKSNLDIRRSYGESIAIARHGVINVRIEFCMRRAKKIAYLDFLLPKLYIYKMNQMAKCFNIKANDSLYKVFYFVYKRLLLQLLMKKRRRPLALRSGLYPMLLKQPHNFVIDNNYKDFINKQLQILFQKNWTIVDFLDYFIFIHKLILIKHKKSLQ